jgi:hypothetical protein
MNNILLATTILAVAAAAAAIVVMYVTFRHERRRSHARALALREMAGNVEPLAEPSGTPIEWDDVATEDDGRLGRPMFRESTEASPWGRRIAGAVTMAAVVAAAGYVLLSRDNTVRPAASVSAAAAAVPALELLSLKHNHEEDRLLITGVVRNPRTSVPLTGVVATAFLFGADGTFLATGRAPIDFSTFTAGDESPFVLTVPVTGAVARYRVGFRGQDGRVIAHVDRRATGTLARTAE